jgi:hypothetical protein
MAPTYTRYLADSRRSGFIRQRSNATGELVWMKAPTLPAEPAAEIRALLCSGPQVLVDGMNDIYAFERTGVRQWKRAKYYGSPVVLQDDLVHFLSPGGRDTFDAVDLANQVRYEHMPVPGMMARAFVTLFEPYRDGLVAQVQDQGIVEDSPPNFMVYHARFKGLGFQWSALFAESTSPIQPLVSWERRRLITSPGNEVLVFDIDGTERAPAPLSRFPFPILCANPLVSCGDDGMLYWAGRGAKGPEVVATDLEGKEQWRWSFVNADTAPLTWPVVTPDTVFLLTDSALLALRGGILLWRYEPEGAHFTFATALGDGSVLATDGPLLHRVGVDGSPMFSLDFEDSLVTPPIIDELGRIYVAGKEMLYAID